MPVAAVMAATAVVGAVSSRNASKRSAAAQRRGQDLASQQVKTGTSGAKQEINRLFPQAIESGRQGFQGALDVFGKTLPQQAQAFQGGNVSAQQTLLAGLQPFQQAILGGQIDLSGLQPFQSQPIDFGFTQQQFPQLQGLAPNQPAVNANTLTGIGPSFLNHNFNRF